MHNHLLILTAPPAAGKTHLITRLIEQLEEPPLFISPLRALANECIAKWGESCVVMTPEEWLCKQTSCSVVVIDEFHLFFYWGDSFRPRMWEAFFALVEKAELVIVLTATLTPQMIEEVKTYTCHFQGITWVDHGNQKLKHKPLRYLKVRSLKWMEDYILGAEHAEGVSLIFCGFRSQVKRWEEVLTSRGFSAWSCVGGEASAFSQRVQSGPPPQFIIATTVLSHGVNLPNISRIFILYEIKNLDFWIQMVARGGRRGEGFEVFALEKPLGIKFGRLSNALAILRLSLRMKVHRISGQIEEWFLKA